MKASRTQCSTSRATQSSSSSSSGKRYSHAAEIVLLTAATETATCLLNLCLALMWLGVGAIELVAFTMIRTHFGNSSDNANLHRLQTPQGNRHGDTEQGEAVPPVFTERDSSTESTSKGAT